MNKSLIRQQILERLNDELIAAQSALQSAHEAATHEDSVAENKYDTFGLEAAYLAHGQARPSGCGKSNRRLPPIARCRCRRPARTLPFGWVRW